MTKEELAIRIEKSNEKINKIEKRITKWTTGMNDEAKAIVAACELVYDDPKYKEAYNAYNEYKKSHEKDPTVYRQDYEWNKGPNFSEAYSAYRDLAEAKNTLNKYETALNKLNNFDNAEKIEVLWSFLQNWRSEIKDWIIDGCELLGRLKSAYNDAWNNYKKSSEYEERFKSRTEWGERKFVADYNIEQQFKEDYYSDVPALSKKFYSRTSTYDNAALDKFLDAEVRAKYNDLVNRITEKAGEIVNADGLYITPKTGQINGIVNGSRNNVRVETISAEGPIQRYHYRTLVHVIK